MALIRGYFDARSQPRVAVTARGARREVALDAVIDTGFNGFLCLPVAVAIGLGLELFGTQQAELADGAIKKELIFLGQAGFAGQPSQYGEILLTESEDALIGVEFLAQDRLEIDFPHSIVRIHLPPRRGRKK